MDLLIAKQQPNPVEYYVEAYAQHPDKPGIFCSYRGTVSREGLIISGEDFDCLLNGLLTTYLSRLVFVAIAAQSSSTSCNWFKTTIFVSCLR